MYVDPQNPGPSAAFMEALRKGTSGEPAAAENRDGELFDSAPPLCEPLNWS